MSRVNSEFSRFAHSYGEYNTIQQIVAKKLIDSGKGAKNILDLGCGRGAIYSLIDWEIESFMGVDFSSSMLSLHPRDKSTILYRGDFNDSNLYDYLQNYSFDHIYSSSALQWADDLDSVMKNLSMLDAPLSLAIFTSNTFASLHRCASIEPILRSSDEVGAILERYFDGKIEIERYILEFDSTLDALRYIKKSGVSGGKNLLDYKSTKKLLSDYDIGYLEFEVLYFYS